MRIAVLLTTYNRKQKTLACLRSLAKQKIPGDLLLDVYVTDDGSADGTAEAIKFYFPEVTVLSGTGSLFWAGGMRSSWNCALKGNYDQYLLLNDDMVLKDEAISILIAYNLTAIALNKNPAICIGNTCNDEGKITYGGRILNSRLSEKSYFVHHDHKFIECDLGNANFMLVPKQTVEKIGILSDAFTHGIADFDYTLKAKEAGIKVLVAPGFVGTCVHDHEKNWKSSNVKLKERIVFLKSPKGLAYKEYLFFIKHHFPFYYPAAFTKLWVKTLFPFLWDALKK